jgi:hypothetical protein
LISSFLKVSGLTLYSPIGDWSPKDAVKANLPFRVGGVGGIFNSYDRIDFHFRDSGGDVIVS